MKTIDLTTGTTARNLLAMLDRLPAQLPLNGKIAHQRLTGQPGSPADQLAAATALDEMTSAGLVTRSGGYLGTPGRFYRITDQGRKALRS